MKALQKITNPRTGKICKPKHIFAENENEILLRFEDYGTDWVYSKSNLTHKAVSSLQFANVFDRITNN